MELISAEIGRFVSEEDERVFQSLNMIFYDGKEGYTATIELEGTLGEMSKKFIKTAEIMLLKDAEVTSGET